MQTSLLIDCQSSRLRLAVVADRSIRISCKCLKVFASVSGISLNHQTLVHRNRKLTIISDLLMLMFLFVTVCFNLAFSAGELSSKSSLIRKDHVQDWKEFSSATGGFSIFFPVIPSKTTGTLNAYFHRGCGLLLTIPYLGPRKSRILPVLHRYEACHVP